MIKYTVAKAANDKSYIQSESGAFKVGQSVVIEEHDVHAETPDLNWKQRRKAIKADEVEVIGKTTVEFKITGVGTEFIDEDGDSRQRFYGEVV